MRLKPTNRACWITVVSLASVVAVGCGDDDDEEANVERYCEIVQELDEAGSEAFAELEGDESATEEDFAEVERQFIEDHQDDFDELRGVRLKRSRTTSTFSWLRRRSEQQAASRRKQARRLLLPKNASSRSRRRTAGHPSSD